MKKRDLFLKVVLILLYIFEVTILLTNESMCKKVVYFLSLTLKGSRDSEFFNHHVYYFKILRTYFLSYAAKEKVCQKTREAKKKKCFFSMESNSLLH